MFTATSAIGLLCLALGGETSDWNQWRGPNRDGVAPSSPSLLRTFPAEGIMPLWTSETVVSGFEGGWSSPAVANGKVYVYAHYKTKKPDAKNAKRQYPWLADDKRGHLTPEQYKEYEVKRREEEFEISKDFVFKETIYCFDALTGKTLWKNETPSVYSRFLQSGSPAVVDGKIVVLGAALNARCRNAETGAVIWDTKLPGEYSDEYYMSSFAVAEGVAVVLAGHLFGIDIATGKMLWEGDAKTTRGSHSSPVVWKTPEREWVLCNVAGKQTVCLDPKTGAEAWRVDSEADQATPIVVGNKLITYGNSRKKGLRCFELSPTGAKQLWAYQGASDSGSSPVVVNGHVYVQGEKRLACVNLETGNDTWKTLLDLSNPRYTSLIAADNMIIYGMDGVLFFEANPEKYVPIVEAKIDQTGRLAAADYFRRELKLDELEKQEGGQAKAMEIFEKKITQHGPVTATTPAIADGKLYVRLKKTIACYDLSSSRTPGLSSTAEPGK